MSVQKHYYLGANTPEGFFSYYDNIANYSDVKRVFCIKGGPGTGKSSFMKKVAKKADNKGYKTEIIHCSSDDDSLDGIYINDLKVAFLDGTAPHVYDPKYPGAADQIINLGMFWDDGKLTEKKHEIIDIQNKISEKYKTAYDYLGATKKFYENNIAIYEKTCNKYFQNSFIEDIIYDEFSELPLTDYIGSKRKLFASAITPTGFKNRLETIFSGYKVYRLTGFYGNVLERLADYTTQRGIDVEMYYCPIFPKTKCEHLVIPDLKIAFTDNNEYHSYMNGENIDFEETEIGRLKYAETEGFNNMMIKKILDRVVGILKEAKKLHDKLEEFYACNTDFDSIMALCDKTIEEILEKY